jgi:hypothetical protein
MRFQRPARVTVLVVPAARYFHYLGYFAGYRSGDKLGWP